MSVITDVCTLRGSNCDSDHYLVRTKIRQRIGKVNEGTHKRSTKWNVTKIIKSLNKKKYEKNIAQKLHEIHPSPGIELEWDNLKIIINDVTYEEVWNKNKHNKC